MRVNSLEELVNYIMNNIMKDEYERYLEFICGENEIIMYVFENRIPIKIYFEDVVFIEDGSTKNKLTAEIYVELCRCNIGRGWLKELDEICSIIEDNEHIFVKLMGKEKTNG